MSTQKIYSSEKEIAAIWKLFRETDRKMQETDRKMQETDRKMQKTDRLMKETGQYIKAISEESKRHEKQLNRDIKKLEELFTGQWGKLMEALVEGDLIKLLQERNIKVEATLTSLKGEYNGKYAEFDIIAVNGKEIVVVEVKTTLSITHVNTFINKLKQFKRWRPEYKDKKVYGAVAYLKAHASSNKYAEKQKLFVIKATGGSASITNPTNFKPKIFS